jgi:hypothetical protein
MGQQIALQLGGVYYFYGCNFSRRKLASAPGRIRHKDNQQQG